MDSSAIVQNYLVSKSGLDNILTLDQFQREFPKGTSRGLVQNIYNELVNQRKEHVVQPVKKETEQIFEIPIEEVVKRNLESSLHTPSLLQKETLDDLVSRLEKLVTLLTDEVNVIDNRLQRGTKEIKTMIQDLDNLRYSRTGIDIDTVSHLIKEAITSVTKFESYIA